jgi:hexosaminidase
MKALQLLLVLGCLTLLSCQSNEKNTGDFNLLPVPQKAEFSGSSALMAEAIQYCHGVDGCKLPVLGETLDHIQMYEDPLKAQIIFEIGEMPDLKPEGYSLSLSKNQISIKAKDEGGLLYAFMTLEQLMVDAGDQGVPLPICKIEDYPLLSYRAIQLDIKHHLEQHDYYYRLMDQLAKYKINAIIAEVEDKLAYERQPLVGSEDALSIDEWIKLSDYAMERNIEISPLVQGLGHASFILKHEHYKDLRDDPESDWAFNPLDPRTYKVQFDLYLDAMEAMPHGRYLHVGGDEVHTTGRGSGKSELELQLTWLSKVCEFAEEHGRIPIF